MLPLCFHHDSLWRARLVGCIVRASPMLVEQSPGTAAKWYMIVQHTIGKELHDDILCTAAPSSSSLGWCIIYLCEMKSGERCILVIDLAHFQGIQTPVHMVCWTLMVDFCLCCLQQTFPQHSQLELGDPQPTSFPWFLSPLHPTH